MAIADEKTVGPATCLRFAGITLDTINMHARLPEDKLARCRGLLTEFYNKRSVTRVKKEFHGFPWKILHGIPWRIRTSISMEFHGNFSIDFHGKYLHGGLGHFPWNSMENIRTPISMEF